MGEAKRRKENKPPTTLNDTVAKLSRDGPMELLITDPFDAIDNSDMGTSAMVVAAMNQFAKLVVDGRRPLCLLCDWEWTDGKVPPPAMLAIVRTAKPFRNDDERYHAMMVSGICFDCACLPNSEFRARVDANYRKDLAGHAGVRYGADDGNAKTKQ